MKIYFKSVLVFSLIGMLGISACEEKLDDAAINPNGIDPSTVDPNLLLPNIESSLGKSYISLGYGDVAGVVQHTQKDAWNTSHNSYDWQPNDWTGYFDILRNNNLMMERAEELGYEANVAIGMIIRAYTFGLMADLYGDLPYTAALNGELDGIENLKPAFDSQETVYMGVIDELTSAVDMLQSITDDSYLNGNYEILFGGDKENWVKFGNSLLLRYYLRISDKNPSVAQSGIEGIYSSGNFISSSADDVTMDYIGADANDSWPSAYNLDNGSSFLRIRMGQPFVDLLRANNDPRLDLWLAPVHVRWVADPTLDVQEDEYIRENGEILDQVVSMNDNEFVEKIAAGNVYTRHFNPAMVSYDTNQYVGTPIQLASTGTYNGNPNSAQSLQNQHVSQLGSIFRNGSGDNLKSRLLTYAEVSFIFAEAALKGWAVGDAETWYYEGIKGSLESWGLGDGYEALITEPGIMFNNSLEQIMTQKWIAGFTVATEAWFDYRRTGFPDFQTGAAAYRNVLPVRFMYGDDELNFNTENANSAIENLQESNYSGPQGKNSPWSKPWLLQGTNKPW